MIEAPHWVKAQGGVPTLRGWKHPKRNEILLPRSFTQEQIDEWHGREVLTEVPAVQPEKQVITEETVVPVVPTPETLVEEDPFANKSKLELEAMGREHGVELDRRKSKATLINTLKGIINKA